MTSPGTSLGTPPRPHISQHCKACVADPCANLRIALWTTSGDKKTALETHFAAMFNPSTTTRQCQFRLGLIPMASYASSRCTPHCKTSSLRHLVPTHCPSVPRPWLLLHPCGRKHTHTHTVGMLREVPDRPFETSKPSRSRYVGASPCHAMRNRTGICSLFHAHLLECVSGLASLISRIRSRNNPHA